MTRSRLFILMLALSVSTIVRAQDNPEPQPQPDELPSLDALLGLEESGSPDRRGPALPDPTQTELSRELSQTEANAALDQAVALMGETADRLLQAGDVGLTTQRLQEDILRKLDQVIAAAKTSQDQSSSSSSSWSSSSQQQPDQQQSQSSSQSSSGENQGDSTLPPGQQAALNPADAPDAAAWGRLPARVREALIQGYGDRYSSLYERLTQEYYRRLAEEDGS